MNGSLADPLARLLRILDLEPRGTDRFRAQTGTARDGRMYGGLLAALTVVAAGRTASGRPLHSLHAYFLRPGRHGVPLDLEVERLRDGVAFSTRRVVASQSGSPSLVMLASFADAGDGIAHEDPAPAAPPPEALPDWEDLRAAALGGAATRRTELAMDLRVCDPAELEPTRELPARRRVWLRLRGALPDDPLIHAAAIVFVSDRTLLRVASRPHCPTWSVRDAASVDHALWLHHPARFDDWILYVCESPAAAAGRAFAVGAMYDRRGRRIASVAQEGIVKI